MQSENKTAELNKHDGDLFMVLITKVKLCSPLINTNQSYIFPVVCYSYVHIPKVTKTSHIQFYQADKPLQYYYSDLMKLYQYLFFILLISTYSLSELEGAISGLL